MLSENLTHISHEIKTPINAILSLSEILLMGDLNKDQRHHIELIAYSSNNLLILISNIMDLSKLGVEKLKIDQDDFDAHGLTTNAVECLRVLADKKNIELSCNIDSNVPPILHGDPNRLRQVLVNLVGNAIKFTDHGSVKLAMRAIDDTKKKCVIRFTVTDTGIGIPFEMQKLLFEPFVQAHTKYKSGGIGLGLAISQNLVDMMGGEIGLESQPGQGSTFWFNLPLCKCDD